MDALEDLQVNSGYSSEDLSKNILQGDKSHVGVIPLLTFKYKVLGRWLGFLFTALGLRKEDVAVLQERTRSHANCFAAATAADADQTWLGRLKPSAVAAFRLLEAPLRAQFPLRASQGSVSTVFPLTFSGGGSSKSVGRGRRLSSRGPTTTS